ncbi:hypothetical protein HRbin15_02202 [bacterium HR15]|nr:hypothetical protein HRbin15_02202 [bacterium HR15]
MKQVLCLILIIGYIEIVSSQEIAFPAGWYTYEQIAQQLSTQGRVVRCDPALKQAVVLLAIKPRSWEQVCSLLERSLDLKIERVNPDASEQWILKLDPQKARREKVLRERFANILAGSGWSSGPDLAALHAIPLPVLVRETPRLTQMARELQQQFRTAAGDTVPSDSQGILTTLTETLSTYSMPDFSREIEEAVASQIDSPDEVFRHRFRLPPEWSGSRELKRKIVLLDLALKVDYFRHILLARYIAQASEPQRRIHDAVISGEHYWIVPLQISTDMITWLVGSKYFSESRKTLTGSATSNPIGVVVYCWDGTPGYVGFEVSTALVYDNWWVNLEHEKLWIKTANIEEIFRDIDETLYREYREASQKQDALLSSPVVQRSVATRLRRQNLYTWLYQWVRHLDQEVIIPLYPHRARCEDAPNLQKLLASLPDRGIWRVEQMEGVWIWRNWLAFLDRAPDLPLAALLQLARSPRTPNDWRRFARQVSPRQARWMPLMPNFPNSESLFGVEEHLGSLPLVAKQWLLFQVLDAVPQWESRLKRTDTLTIAWQELAPAKRRAWVQRLLQVGTEGLPEALHPWVWLGRADVLVQSLEQAGVVRVSRVRGGVSVVLQVGEQQWLGCVIPLKLGQD